MPDSIRLADFIRAEMEALLRDWEVFAQTILPARRMDTDALRDHARDMLLAMADDLESHQSDSEQAAKSKGRAPGEGGESWAEVHGGDRHESGFSVMETISEFRALRASVVLHWTKACLTLSGEHLDDLTRFHEAIDQAVAQSLEQFSTEKEMQTRLFGAVLLASPDPIYVVDLQFRIIYANKATAELFALEPAAILGRTTMDLGFSFASAFRHNLERVIAEQSPYRGRFDHSFGPGHGERFEYLLAPVLDEEGHTEATVCILRDVTEQAFAEEQIWHAAHHDALTGLPNRRLFLDRLEQEMKHAKRSNLPLWVLFMDLDGFKQVNDSFGHETGDILLSAVAERLRNCIREEDTVARHGGDEFTVIVTGARHHADVERVARKIRVALAMPFQLAQEPVRIGVSIGISSYPRDATSPRALLEAADQAMYRAKKAALDQKVAGLP